MSYKLYSDGGARGNPGPAASAFLLYKDNDLIETDSVYLGDATNNQAEYQALIQGLTAAIKNQVKELECFLDSELVVKQLKGEYKVKNPNIKNLNEAAKGLAERFENIVFTHIPRSENRFADKLVNIVLDARKPA